MIQELKTIFSPRSAVGLQVGRSFISAVQVGNPGHSPFVERIAYQEVNEPEEMVRELEGLFQREGLHPEVLVTSLPTWEATIREIEVDFQNPRKLEKIIKYQIEPHVPYPIEDMVVDFFPPEQGGTILTIGIRKETLSAHLTALSSVQMIPQAVSLEDVALFSLLAKTRPDRGDDPVAILHGGGTRNVLQVVRRKNLDFVRVLPGSRDLEVHLQESLGLYAMKNRGPLKEILITGQSAVKEITPERITEWTGVRASYWRPFDQVRHGLGDLSLSRCSRE